ncbi:MAG: plasmid pRiA4b ORF-3 family protein [Clostridiales bacterium]|nr:plasmid pRiA4b ORF-3 family protein [Clostridiales bacterium]MCF8023073.1 plasmid pRiA4b ORF-3 family protein [Clostridiales bacterium]
MQEQHTVGAKKEDLKRSKYIMKIWLRDIEPPIWRRFQVPGNISLYKLHQIIQIVMRWQDYHLFQFTIKNKAYGEPDLDYGY